MVRGGAKIAYALFDHFGGSGWGSGGWSIYGRRGICRAGRGYNRRLAAR